MRGARIWDAPRIGSPAKTNLSVPATAAATTVKGSTLKGPHRDRWTGRISNSRPTGRFLWIRRSCTHGQRDSPANLLMLDHNCPVWRQGVRRPRTSRRDAGATEVQDSYG